MRRGVIASLSTVLLLTASPPALARAAWKQKIDAAIGGHSVSVAVRAHGRRLYSHAATDPRVPASNEKLLLSMALLHELGPDFRFPTFVRSRKPKASIIYGNLWLFGRGDPSLGAGTYASSLPFGGTRIGRLARKIRAAGIRKIRGRVMGVVGYFAHDWFARGWKYNFPADEVPLPSALTIDGNVVGHRHIDHPERRAALILTRKLRGLGVKVWHRAAAGTPPSGLRKITQVTSKPLWMLMRYMDHKSSNFFAEVLGKRLGLERYGRPGTIAKAARAIASWASRHGVAVTAYDASGLSSEDRVTARGIARLLQVARKSSWGPTLRRILPTGNEGTLEHRLRSVPVRAKTGTLDGISALSGWVWLRKLGRWGEFSILDSGMSKDRASSIEDSIVRTLWRHAR
jgi:serine-type D-Ala-D-Ala carboxypeptidase/endopeptidase (penicillin-binding protein 4)